MLEQHRQRTTERLVHPRTVLAVGLMVTHTYVVIKVKIYKSTKKSYDMNPHEIGGRTASRMTRPITAIPEGRES